MPRPDPPGVTTRADVDLWQKAADTALIDEVKTLRATAVAWAGSIATLTGLFALLGVSFAALAAEKIPATAIVETQLVLVGAFVLMLLASICAIGASQGLPISTLANGETYRNVQQKIATTVVHRLAISRLLAAGGMVALIVAGGKIVQQRIELLTEPASGYFQVIQANGPMLCGYGYYNAKNTFYLLKEPKTDQPTSDQLINVKPTDVRAVSTCAASSIKSSP